MVAGRAEALDFGGGARDGFFVAKLGGTSGNHVWSKGFTATTISGLPSLVIVPHGDLVLAGNFGGVVDFGGGPIASVGAETVAVAKLSSAGGYQWAKTFPARSSDSSAVASSRVSNGGLSSDACGNLFLTGNFGATPGQATIDFGAGPLVSPMVSGASHVFLAKLSPSGSGVWSKRFIGTNGMSSSEGKLTMRGAAAENANGPTIAAHLAGSTSFGFQESVDFGGGTLTNASESSLAVATFDEGGSHRWSYVGGPPSTARESVPAAIASLASTTSAIVLAGNFGRCPTQCSASAPGTTLVLGGKVLTATSARDMVLFRFSR